jgi:hypothetical protein
MYSLGIAAVGANARMRMRGAFPRFVGRQECAGRKQNEKITAVMAVGPGRLYSLRVATTAGTT